MGRVFGNNLMELIKARNLSVAQLAAELKQSRKTVQEWVTNSRIPRDPLVLKALSERLQVSVHYLLYGYEDSQDLIATILEKTEIHSGLYEISIKRVTTRKGDK